MSQKLSPKKGFCYQGIDTGHSGLFSLQSTPHVIFLTQYFTNISADEKAAWRSYAACQMG